MPKLFIQMDREILSKHYENGFTSIYAFGREGSGKTAYALWLGYKIFGNWDKVLRHLYLEPQPFLVDMFRYLEKGDKLLYAIADDPGRWLNKLEWMRNEVKGFIKFYNIIRTACTGIIFTSPADDVVKDIRKKAHVRSKVYYIKFYVNRRKPKPVKQVLGSADVFRNFYGVDILNENYSIIHHTSMEINIMFKEYPVPEGTEIYPTYYPDKVYTRYNEMRRKAALNDLKSMINYWERRTNLSNILKYFSEEELVSLGLYVMNKLIGVSLSKLEQLTPYSRATLSRRIRWVEAKLYEYISNIHGEEKAHTIVDVKQ